MSQVLNNSQFIEKARKAHGDKYDYSKVNYVNARTKVCIICPIHGEFWQEPNVHIRTCGCTECGKNIKQKRLTLTNQQFIEKAKQIHGDKYDYSKVNYVNAKTEVCIICPIHGEFWQKPTNHLQGNGCHKCAKLNRYKNSRKQKTTNDFISECREKYNERFDYSKTVYIDAKTPVIVYDKILNNYLSITPTQLLSKKRSSKKRTNKDNFVEKAREKYGDKYDYNETEYINSKTKIKFRCPIHGELEQLPSNHLKYGCRLCSHQKKSASFSLTKDQFIEKSRKVHGDRYDYSKVEYVNNRTKVCIICPEHGEFWQSPSKHLSGHGCPKCKKSYLEYEISVYLNKNNIKYVEQYSPLFLKNGRGLQRLDFYLPDYNIAIECQGIQHFINTNFSYNSKVTTVFERDLRKYNKCINNNINILYYVKKEIFQLKDIYPIYNEQNTFYDCSFIKEYITRNYKN